MDVLPIQEVVEWEHKNKVAGKMHVCGHDAHVAMLFGVAKMLKAYEHHLKASLHLRPTLSAPNLHSHLGTRSQ